MILARPPCTGVTRCGVFLPLKTLSVPGASGSGAVEERLQFRNTGPEGLHPDERVKAEHAGFAQIVPAASDQPPTAHAPGLVDGPAIEVEGLSQYMLLKAPSSRRSRLYSQFSSSG